MLGTTPAAVGPRLDALWHDLAADLGPTLASDRRLFLGARTFTARSCVSVERADVFPAIDGGGVGTRTVYLWASTRDRRRSPAADFAWQQTVLKGFLERLQGENDALSGQAVRLADQAKRLARALRDGAALPEPIATADGLGPPQASARFWPDAFFGGWQWPEWWRGPQYDMYTAELYARGLDNYVWVEGYVIRGPNAGTLVRASVPYLPNRAPAATVRVFQPPVPQPARATDG